MGVMLTKGPLTVPVSAATKVCGMLVEVSNELLIVVRGLPEGPVVETLVTVSSKLADTAREFSMAVHGCNPPRAS
jgi:hypothetical protein